jgi:hypothetical protein
MKHSTTQVRIKSVYYCNMKQIAKKENVSIENLVSYATMKLINYYNKIGYLKPDDVAKARRGDY